MLWHEMASHLEYLSGLLPAEIRPKREQHSGALAAKDSG